MEEDVSIQMVHVDSIVPDLTVILYNYMYLYVWFKENLEHGVYYPRVAQCGNANPRRQCENPREMNRFTDRFDCQKVVSLPHR